MVQGGLRTQPAARPRGGVTHAWRPPSTFPSSSGISSRRGRFYGDLLGCREERSTETWVDFDFFGNQISAHTIGKVPPTQATGQVDGVAVPMPHFGAVLPWDRFQALAEKLTQAGVAFVIPPRVRFPGQTGEQATLFLLDPSGNALEFKSFRNPTELFSA
jgi:extradiol dioxygenase family protein